MKNKNIKLAVVAAFSLGLLGVSLSAKREKESPKVQSLKSDTLVVVKPVDTVVSVRGKKFSSSGIHIQLMLTGGRTDSAKELE